MSYTSNYDLSPKSSIGSSSSNESLSSSYDNTSFWSPFSTPVFSPYSVNSSSILTNTNSFQYSYSYEPSQFSNSRVISRSGNFEENSAYQPSNVYGQIGEKAFQRNGSQPINVQNTNNCNSSHKHLPKRSEQIDLKDLIKKSAIQRQLGGRAKQCTFCKTNGESQEVYNSHCLKDYNDRITCPILLRYSCPICGATGEKVHTKKYCPTLQKKNRLELLNNLTSGQ
jgi:hypothetical protein